ncbi:MAG: apolipoprotein N-acyltransferase, partial [Pseudomonadota bacterium]
MADAAAAAVAIADTATRAAARLRTWLADQSAAARGGAAFLCGGLAALSFAPTYAIPLLFVAVTILVWLIDIAADRPRPLRAASFIGWTFGFGYFLVGIYWVSFSMLVEADRFAWMIPFAVSGLPAFLALFSAAAAALAAKLWRPGSQRVVIFAVIWVLSEYLRGHILTGFPWNLFGQV